MHWKAKKLRGWLGATKVGGVSCPLITFEVAPYENA